MGDVEKAKTGKQVEVGGLELDAFSDLGRLAEALIEADDRGGVQGFLLSDIFTALADRVRAADAGASAS
ncbi:hypothetical protein [Sphingomonas sp. IW22]|uniref:hypothetical protein n=1 Tax=Sphingomonas sp. IW22 TaxID=3242489 RepID=UPI0035214F3D